jgi:pyrroloquinoline quinone biosynthesis protein D
MNGLSAHDIPHLPRGVRVHFDPVRSAQVLLAPERVFDLDDVAAEVLKLVDGQRTIRQIADTLAMKFDGERDVIEADVIEMLAELANKRILAMMSRSSPQDGCS